MGGNGDGQSTLPYPPSFFVRQSRSRARTQPASRPRRWGRRRAWLLCRSRQIEIHTGVLEFKSPLYPADGDAYSSLMAMYPRVLVVVVVMDGGWVLVQGGYSAVPNWSLSRPLFICAGSEMT